MVTEADNPESSFDMISVNSPISSLKFYIYYNKTAINGCIKKCPCRVWVQCSYYNSARRKKLRGDKDSLFKEINEWYETFFKYKPGLPDATYANG